MFTVFTYLLYLVAKAINQGFGSVNLQKGVLVLLPSLLLINSWNEIEHLSLQRVHKKYIDW